MEDGGDGGIAHLFIKPIADGVEDGSNLISNWNESQRLEESGDQKKVGGEVGCLRMYPHKIYAFDAQSLTSASLCIGQELKLEMENGVCAGITKHMNVGD